MVRVLLLAGRVADLLSQLGVGGAQLDGVAPENVAERDSRAEGETEQDCPATVRPYGVPDLVLGTLSLSHGSLLVRKPRHHTRHYGNVNVREPLVKQKPSVLSGLEGDDAEECRPHGTTMPGLP